jgi:hypothetical protein
MCLAQDVGPRAEAALPQAVAEQGHVGAAGAVLVGREPAAEDGLQVAGDVVLAGRSTASGAITPRLHEAHFLVAGIRLSSPP